MPGLGLAYLGPEGPAARESLARGGPQLLLQVVEELRDVRKGREMLSFGGCRHLWPPFATVAAGSKMAGQEIRTSGGALVSPRLFSEG